MECPRCKNTDPRFFAYDQGTWYCRKCISFSRIDIGSVIEPCHLSHKRWQGRVCLDYELTEEQRRCSSEVCSFLKQGRDVFLYAATGAGKTEITFESIAAYLHQGKKVAFAISRRQVVLEIAQRLRKAFQGLRVVEVAQDYTRITDGDLIVCTMHQLYRYPYGFDLLILDEVDAFPYAGNELLEQIADLSCIGQKLYLSATPSDEIKKKIERKEMEVVKLFTRPHRHPLVVPDVICLPVFLQVVYTIGFCLSLVRQKKQILVFVPRRLDCMWMEKLLNLFVSTGSVHAQTKDKDEVIMRFRKKEFSVLVCTTLLERGVTIGGVQVLVFQGQHPVFSTASLVQIFGRIGRTFEQPTGKGVCLCQYTDESIRSCNRILNEMNASASSAAKV